MRWIAVLAALGAGCGRVGFDGPAAPPSVIDALPDAPDPDLVVWLPLDGDPRAGTIDAAGTLAPGACDGACPTQVAGRIGGAYDFAGGAGGGAVTFPSLAALDFGARHQPMSVALWYRTRTIGSAQQVALAKPIAGGQVSYQLALEDLDGDDDLDVVFKVCEAGCAGEEFASAYEAAQAGAWHLLVGTWDGLVSKLYIDGLLRGAAGKSGIVFDDSPLYLGADLEVAGIEDVFDGQLDDVRIYARALSVDDQRALLAQ